MDNEFDQSKVAYENGPKEVNTHRGMPKSKQFGKHKMPQDSKSSNRAASKELSEDKVMEFQSHGRHEEFR
jgi:hypothetical protein